MKVREIMTSNVECVGPDTLVHELADKMKTLDVGFVPICDNDRIVGTVTDRDIVIRGIAGGKDLASTKAREIMSNEVFWCFEDQDVRSVARLMSEKEVRRMLILNKNKRLVGVVSIGDISKVEHTETGKALRDIAEAA